MWRKWRAGTVRPIPGNAPHDRPVSRGILSLKEHLRPSLTCHSAPLLSNTEAPRIAFSEAWRNLSVRCGLKTKTKPRARAVPPPVGRPGAQVKERAGRITLLSSSAMSSGRLFLDQVGRHQSLSPLHRHEQIIMAFPGWRQKRTFLLCQRGGHFYFAATGQCMRLTRRAAHPYNCNANTFGAISKT